MVTPEALKSFLYHVSGSNVDFTVSLYSGRGMYGEQCLGFTVSNPLQFMFELGKVARTIENDEDDHLYSIIEDMERQINQDSMGMSSIVYFPRVKLTSEHYLVVESFRGDDHDRNDY